MSIPITTTGDRRRSIAHATTASEVGAGVTALLANTLFRGSARFDCTRRGQRGSVYGGVVLQMCFTLLMLSGCMATTMKPVAPPLGKALLKINSLKPDARDFTVDSLAECRHSISVCRINEIQRPTAIEKPFG